MVALRLDSADMVQFHAQIVVSDCMNWKYVDIERLGSPDNSTILDHEEDELIVEEKVDGGNGCFFLHEDGTIHVCSRNRDLTAEKDEKSFKKSREWILANVKEPNLNFCYYFEHMQKHTISYGEGIPPIIGFDIKPKEGAFDKEPQFIGRKAKEAEFERIGVPCVNLIWKGTVSEFKKLNPEDLLKTSAYYSQAPEGIVIKNYNRTNVYGRALFAKIVRDDFKELNRATFDGLKKDHSDSLKFAETYFTDARIRKRIHALTQESSLPLDRKLMQFLVVDVIKDVFKEELPSILKFSEIVFPVIKQKASKRCLEVLDGEIILKQKEDDKNGSEKEEEEITPNA